MTPSPSRFSHFPCLFNFPGDTVGFGKVAFGAFGRERNGAGVVKLALIGSSGITLLRDIAAEAAPIAIVRFRSTSKKWHSEGQG